MSAQIGTEGRTGDQLLFNHFGAKGRQFHENGRNQANSSKVLQVRNVRIFVEPVDVELDDDEGLQWTSLQTAFPGCSGMYYRDRDSPCKSAVKFDGKKFRAPGGAWNDREYYITLSQRCHSAQMPFGSYENASKQFERSVNAVQAMLASTMGGRKMRTASTVLPPSPPTEKSVSSSHPSSSEPVEPIQAIQEREILLRSASRQLTPIEQQFVDLAKISTAKDSIIEGHREQIRKLSETLGEVEKKLKEVGQQCKEYEMRINAQEDELKLFRDLGEQQNCMNSKVAELTTALEKRDAEVKTLKERLETREAEWQQKEPDLVERNRNLSLENEQKTQEIIELREKLEVAEVSRTLLGKELDQLRPLAEIVELEHPENVKKYAKILIENGDLAEKNLQLEKELQETKALFEEIQLIQNSVTMENTKLMNRNVELESRLTHVDEELTKINGEWKERLETQQKSWRTEKSDLEQEVEAVKNSLADCQRMLETATRDAAENDRRLKEVTSSRDEMRKCLETAEFRHQEPLKRQIRTLSEDLIEAQERVAELTCLVGSLTSDAHNSRRDIDDLI